MSMRSPKMDSDYRRRSTLGSSHPQRPVTSSKGGYLRCPFEISPRFADLAARLVASSSSAQSARRERSSNAAEADDEFDGFREGRPWTRAGIDVKRLTAREKRAQQEQSERIYGSSLHTAEEKEEEEDREALKKNAIPNNHINPINGSNEDAPKHSLARDSEGGRRKESRGGGGVFAMDIREKQALQKLVPRHLRVRQERAMERESCDTSSVVQNGNPKRKGEDGVVSERDHDVDEAILRKGRGIIKPSDAKISEKMAMTEKNVEEHSKGPSMSSKEGLTEDKSANMDSGLILASNSTTSTAVDIVSQKKQKRMRPNEKRLTSNPPNAAVSSAVGNGASPSPSSQLPNARPSPMNKMQRLEEIRMKALFGKKKRY